VDEEMAADGAQDEGGRPPTTPPSTPRSSRPSSSEARPGPAGLHQPELSELTQPSPHPLSWLASGHSATSSSTPNINSPVANHSSPDNMVRYLRTLSDEKVYTEFIDALLVVEGFNLVCPP